MRTVQGTSESKLRLPAISLLRNKNYNMPEINVDLRKIMDLNTYDSKKSLSRPSDDNFDVSVRNLVSSHNWLEKNGYVRKTGEIRDGANVIEITDLGRIYYEENIESLIEILPTNIESLIEILPTNIIPAPVLEIINFSIENVYEQEKIQKSKILNDRELLIRNNRIPVLSNSKTGKKFIRDNRISKTALSRAEFKCEIDGTIGEFLTKNNEPYVEGHHLIPMSMQKYFATNIDRIENICSLHSGNHKAIHFGNKDEINKRLRKLFEIKEEGLINAGINIDFKVLAIGYRI